MIIFKCGGNRTYDQSDLPQSKAIPSTPVLVFYLTAACCIECIVNIWLKSGGNARTSTADALNDVVLMVIYV